MRLRHTLPILGLLLGSLTIASDAHAELNAYLRIKGQKSGDIKGGSTQKGREDAIIVIAVSHEIVSPRDPATGQATGKRQHKPFVITKELDKSTPILRQVLATNETLPSFTIEFWRPSQRAATGVGAEEKYLTIKLTNANIASIRQVMPNNKNPDLTRYLQYEEVAFTYQKIEWTWTDGGITSSDDWVTPVN